MTHSPRRHPLLFTAEGDLDLTWPVVLWCIGMATVGILVEVFIKALSQPAWAFLGATFTISLLAAIPVAKERILARATTPASIAAAIAAAGIRPPSAVDQAAAAADDPPSA